ncbi:MAG: hypothetical protein ACSLEW_05685 [Nocardioides sp.]
MKLAVLAPLSIVLLSLTACGDSDPEVAARAGDVAVSTDRADDVTGGYCEALAAVDQVTTRSGMRGYVANALAIRDLSAEFAASYGVDLDAALADQTASFVASLPQLPRVQAESVAEVELVPTLPQVLGPLVGAAIDPTGTDADQATAGTNAYDDYLAAHPVSLSPSFGGPRVVVPVSGRGLLAGMDATQVGPEEASALPPAEQCGSAAVPSPS